MANKNFLKDVRLEVEFSSYLKRPLQKWHIFENVSKWKFNFIETYEKAQYWELQSCWSLEDVFFLHNLHVRA